jgi:hypothetical protein
MTRTQLRLHANSHAKGVHERHARAGSGPATSKNRRTRALRSKGDDPPPDYRPVKTQWCTYATGWIRVKTIYALAVSPRERDALTEMLRTCPTP